MTLSVTQERTNVYTIKLSDIEFAWLADIAAALGMTKACVLAASCNQGLTHYHTMCVELGNQEREGKKRNDVLNPGAS